MTPLDTISSILACIDLYERAQAALSPGTPAWVQCKVLINKFKDRLAEEILPSGK